MKKVVKKTAVAFIVAGSVIGTGLVSFVTAASIWANKPRGIRIKLEDED